MKLRSWRFLNRFGGGVPVAFGVLAALRVSGAQSVIMAPPAAPIQPQAAQDDATNNEMSVFGADNYEANHGLPEPLTFGPVVFRPHPYYHFLYDSGIKSGTNNSASSVIQEISPGMSVDLGRQWTLDYTPTVRLYSNHVFHDSVDESATLRGGMHYEDWVFGVLQTYLQSDTTLDETAAQTKQETFDTELNASRQLNDKMSAEFGLSQIFNFVSGIQDSRTWSTTEWLNYEFNPRFIVGAGIGGGYVKIESDSGGPSNPDQSFESMSARVQWRATDKISFLVTGGFEEREILASGYNNELNPTFNVGIEYALFKHTDLSFSAGRAVSSSDYSILAQDTETTSVSFNINQRLLEEFYLNVGLGYQLTDYSIAVGPFSVARSDNDYNVSVRLSHAFLKRGNAAITYQYTQNQSSDAGFSYTSNQIGFEIGFNY